MARAGSRIDPIPTVFLAGFGYAIAAGEVFAIRYSDDIPWAWNLAMGSLAFSLAVVLSLTAIWQAFRQRRRLWLVTSLAFYWLFAFAGLLVLALATDPIPFLSTIVAAILSVMVAWLIQTYIASPPSEKPASNGWWQRRRRP